LSGVSEAPPVVPQMAVETFQFCRGFIVNTHLRRLTSEMYGQKLIVMLILFQSNALH
jgi:hypothetical protein